MQSSSPQKFQPPTKDASFVIHRLTPNVKDLIDLLPSEDKEVFAYLISHPSEDANTEPLKHQKFCKTRADSHPKSPRSLHVTNKGNDFRKARFFYKKGDHPPSFGCECFQCYMFHWSRWDASPNQEIIHQAILLNDSVCSSECDASTGNRTQWEKQPVCHDETSSEVVGSGNREVKTACSKPFPLNSNNFSSIGNGKVALDRDSYIEKVTARVFPQTKNLVAKKNIQKQGRSRLSSSEYLSNKEDKAQKKKPAKKSRSTKQNNDQEQEMPHLLSTVKKKTGEPSTKYKSRQVAPVDFNDAYETSPKSQMAETLEGFSNKDADDKRRAHSTQSFSETLSFVADRLLSMWYPRRPRGVKVLMKGHMIF